MGEKTQYEKDKQAIISAILGYDYQEQNTMIIEIFKEIKSGRMLAIKKQYDAITSIYNSIQAVGDINVALMKDVNELLNEEGYKVATVVITEDGHGKGYTGAGIAPTTVI